MTARPLIDAPADGERLGADDMATRREEEFRELALVKQQLQASGGQLVQAGVCTNCGERCHPKAVYCDADCRADHEARMQRQARQRRSLG